MRSSFWWRPISRLDAPFNISILSPARARGEKRIYRKAVPAPSAGGGSRIASRIAPLGLLALTLVLLVAPATAAADTEEAWAALAAGGHVALIRHANAPPGYGGDPPGFRLDDCKTQRNLDELGRQQARALG